MPNLEIPPFVSVGGGSVGPGFLGMTWAPFVVNNNGEVRNTDFGKDQERMYERLKVLEALETSFVNENRGGAAEDHYKVLKKTVNSMTSKQMDAFRVNKEPTEMQEKYGRTAFGRG